jgi:hypothetical protein
MLGSPFVRFVFTRLGSIPQMAARLWTMSQRGTSAFHDEPYSPWTNGEQERWLLIKS